MQHYIELIFPWLTVLILAVVAYILVLEKEKWTVVYTFKKLPEKRMTFDSMRDAEENALTLGFKHFKKTKMVVNYSEKTITIS